MFERFTEKARRVIFFARYEASQFGTLQIETEHLLLGILREDKALISRVAPPDFTLETVRKEIEAVTKQGEQVPSSVDIPLSRECQRVLVSGVEEADMQGCKHIGTEHFLVGLMREENFTSAKILRGHGVRSEEVREKLKTSPSGENG